MTTLIVLVVVCCVGYRVSLGLWPYTSCRRCQGSSQNAGSNRHRWGACRRCNGSGRRERLGVRLFVRRR